MTDAADIALAVRSVAGVVDLHPGPFGTASTFTSQGRIWGVRTGPTSLDVHLSIESGFNALEVAAGVRAAIVALDHDLARLSLPISVHIEDIKTPATAAPITHDVSGRNA